MNTQQFSQYRAAQNSVLKTENEDAQFAHLRLLSLLFAGGIDITDNELRATDEELMNLGAEFARDEMSYRAAFNLHPATHRYNCTESGDMLQLVIDAAEAANMYASGYAHSLGENIIHFN